MFIYNFSYKSRNSFWLPFELSKHLPRNYQQILRLAANPVYQPSSLDKLASALVWQALALSAPFEPRRGFFVSLTHPSIHCYLLISLLSMFWPEQIRRWMATKTKSSWLFRSINYYPLLLGISFGNGLKQHLDRQLELLISWMKLHSREWRGFGQS